MKMSLVEEKEVVENSIHDKNSMKIMSSCNNSTLKSDDGLDSTTKIETELTTEVHSIKPLLQNVIASVNLNTVLDLRKIAISARNAEYNPRKVNAVVLRLRNPKCTGLIFRSGRMMITGAKSEYGAKLGGKKIAKLCMKIGHPNLRFKGFKIENMIASADCGFPIRLDGLANQYSSFCSYEPELFPGLVYRYKSENGIKAVLLIFVSGKIILTGCQTLDQVYIVFDSLYSILSQYKK